MEMPSDFGDGYYTSTLRRNFDESPRMVSARRGMEIGAKRNHGGGAATRGIKLAAKSGKKTTESNLVNGPREFTPSYVNALLPRANDRPTFWTAAGLHFRRLIPTFYLHRDALSTLRRNQK